MVKPLFYNQTGGRRAGDARVQWEFSWRKTIVTVVTTVVGAVLIAWGTSITTGANAGKQALAKVNRLEAEKDAEHARMNQVLHQRITDEYNRIHDEFDRKYDKMIDLALGMKEKDANAARSNDGP